jgi:hypothetical protein
MGILDKRAYARLTLATVVFGVRLAMTFLTCFPYLLGIWDLNQGLTGHGSVTRAPDRASCGRHAR